MLPKDKAHVIPILEEHEWEDPLRVRAVLCGCHRQSLAFDEGTAQAPQEDCFRIQEPVWWLDP